MELITNSLSYMHRRISNLSYLGGKIPGNFTRVNLNKLIKDTVEFIKLWNDDFIKAQSPVRVNPLRGQHLPYHYHF
ncbi:hypothetical protein MBAV_004682 [Candidatus Magnetobacterium bavaricum]|uniref:Uncharacterized protein n=1 Tax=Candidatus Magnetobacterium bavaricum TaxID=29290 RepID=A0A0F3GMC2_9BACT|nr:hypothetical protein MBAV_004682 [Candidatus Magnetobacterium bavaricum]